MENPSTEFKPNRLLEWQFKGNGKSWEIKPHTIVKHKILGA